MDSKVSYSIVGVFVIVLSIALIYIIFWLTAGVSSKHYKTYLAYMNESVSGLSTEASVKYNGVNVGYVDDITLNPEDPTQVKLVLNIEDDVPIREDVTATIETQGLTGIAYIGLRGGTPGSPLLRPHHGQEYPVIQTRPSLLLRLDTTLRNLTANLDKISDNIKDILDEKNRENIKKSLANIEKVSSVLANNSEEIDEAIGNMNKLLRNTSKASEHFPQLVNDAEQSLHSFRNMADTLNHAGGEISITMRKGRGFIDHMTTQLSPKLYSTLQNVSDLSLSLKNLSEDLENNPDILLRGTAPAKPGPGEVAR